MHNKLFNELMTGFYEDTDSILISVHDVNADSEMIATAIKNMRDCRRYAIKFAKQKLSEVAAEFAIIEIKDTVDGYIKMLKSDDLQEQLDIIFG